LTLEEKINNLEIAINNILDRLAKVEQKVGISSAGTKETLAAPIPTAAPTPPTPTAPTSTAPTPTAPTPTAPTPTAPTPTAPTPKAPEPTFSGIEPVVKKKQIIKQTLPRGGATSQIKAKKGQYNCPQCDSDYYEELDDKTKPMYTMGPGMAIYKKKLRCWNCGYEWPKPS
jgi:hypothetical protein